MRFASYVVAMLLGGALITACSSGSFHRTRSSVRLDPDDPSVPPNVSDRSDDNEILYFGRKGDPSQMMAITALLHAYYAAGSRGDGTAGCRLVYALTIEMLASESDRVASSRRRCIKRLTAWFTSNHEQLLLSLGSLRIVGLRVLGAQGLVMLKLATPVPMYVEVHREGGRWKMKSLIEQKFP